MSDEPELSDVKVIASTDLFSVESVDVAFSNGVSRRYERLHGGRFPGAVVIVPMLGKDTMLLIREYGVGIEQYTLGFPKGGINPGESSVETAHRELREEVNYDAKELSLLTRFSLMPSYMPAFMDVYLAQSLFESSLVGDEPEPLGLVPWKLSQVDQLLAHPEFIECRSIAALLLLERRQRA